MNVHRSKATALRCAVLSGLFAVATLATVGGATDDAIDWNRARVLRQKQQQGIALDAVERAYLERAMAARQRAESNERTGRALPEGLSPREQAQARELMRKRQSGESLTEAERALAQKLRTANMNRKDAGPRTVAEATAAPSSESLAAIPLPEMTAEQRYKGREGGLYGEGRNEPPPAHLKAALAAASQIAPRGSNGERTENGKVVLLSVGMSNTTQEYSRFKEIADRDPAKSKHVLIVDGAQGGQAAADWAESADGRIWQTVDTRLKNAGASAAQVQVVWIKQADKRPTNAFPVHAKKLEANLEKIVQMLKSKFPNLGVVYLSSRTYAGYGTTPLNPEPYAYESAFAVRDLVQRQIAGDASLTFDAAKGAVRAPLLLWGPYLWANGAAARKSDGLAWNRDDFAADGTHPSSSGREKVAQQLLTFFKNDPTAQPWFVAGRGKAIPAK